MDLASALAPICAQAVSRQVTPGGVITVATADSAIGTFTFGTTASLREGGVKVTGNTIYDLASLTKPMATVALAMRSVSTGKLDISKRVCELAPWLDRPIARRIEVRHLLGHASGLPAHVPFYQHLLSSGSSRPRRTQLLALAKEVEIESPPGNRAVYSDVGYIILGALLERIWDRPLDKLFATEIADRGGLTTTTYSIAKMVVPNAANIAPTEHAPDLDGRRLCGIVHDENARAGQAPLGHAGLFGTAIDVLRFAIQLNRAVRGEDNRIFDPQVARHFVNAQAAPKTSWRLGWDTPSPPPVKSHAGDLWAPSGFGHLGFTGTSLWLDPERGRAIVILTNRVYYSRDPKPIRDFRREIMDTVSRHLDRHSRFEPG